MSSTAYRALVDDLIANDSQLAEVVAGMKELDPRRRQELVEYVQEILEEQRATKV